MATEQKDGEAKAEPTINGGDTGSSAAAGFKFGKAPSLESNSPLLAAAPALHPHSIQLLKQTFLDSPDEQPKLKWRNWFQLFEDHLLVQGLQDIQENRKLALLRTSLGAEGYRICTELCSGTLSFDETVQRLAERFAPRASQIYERAQFNMRNQRSGENSLQYITVLRSLAATCGYPEDYRNQLIRDRFVAGCSENRIRERLLLENDDLTLEAALQIAQNLERAVSESSSVHKQSDASNSIFKLGHSNRTHTPARPSRSKNRFDHRSPSSHRSSSRKPLQRGKCYNCGGSYPHNGKCPAKGKTCTTCGKLDHFNSVCQSGSHFSNSKNNSRSSSPSVRVIKTVSSRDTERSSSFKYIDCSVGGRDVKLLIDLGAKVSVLNREFVNSLESKPLMTTYLIQHTT